MNGPAWRRQAGPKVTVISVCNCIQVKAELALANRGGRGGNGQKRAGGGRAERPGMDGRKAPLLRGLEESQWRIRESGNLINRRAGSRVFGGNGEALPDELRHMSYTKATAESDASVPAHPWRTLPHNAP